MDRDNLRARLEDIFRYSVEEKIEAYEKLVENRDVSEIERFVEPHGRDVVFEVKRRIKLTMLLAENAGMKKIARRAERLLDKFE